MKFYMTSTFCLLINFSRTLLNKIKLFVAFIRNYTLKSSNDFDEQQNSYYVHINESFWIKILIN